MKAPGIYIKEKNTLGRSLESVETAIPAFIGYTEKHARISQNQDPVVKKISNLDEFHQVFGKRENISYGWSPLQKEKELIDSSTDESPKKKSAGGNKNTTSVPVLPSMDPNRKFFLYDSLRLYFMNGGRTCYIISVGDYANTPDKEKLSKGLKKLEEYDEPTLIVVPDAMGLSDDNRNELYKEMLEHAATSQKRFAILDCINEGLKKEDGTDNIVNLRGKALKGIDNNLAWGAMYYPWLDTNIVKATEIGLDIFNNDNNYNNLKQFLKGEERKNESLIDQIFQIADDKAKEKALIANIPAYNQLVKEVLKTWNILPPCGAITGIFVQNDKTRGVQHAPANLPVAGIINLAHNITDDQQGQLNAPVDGKAINCIRQFTNSGIRVWGARTLDGNSLDWRYTNVRRTMIMLEQSIKNFLIQFLFAPNDNTTWVKIRASLTNYLTAQWTKGILTGETVSEAFDFALGEGKTMTAEDINEGIMRLVVRLAIARPAEFIEVTFEQKQKEAPDAEVSEGGEEGGDDNAE